MWCTRNQYGKTVCDKSYCMRKPGSVLLILDCDKYFYFDEREISECFCAAALRNNNFKRIQTWILELGDELDQL